MSNLVHYFSCLHCGTDTHNSNLLCPSCAKITIGQPTPAKFAFVGTKVMQGSTQRAVASSRTFARRIANALNRYTPNEKGY
jgi:hypothetical protein